MSALDRLIQSKPADNPQPVQILGPDEGFLGPPPQGNRSAWGWVAFAFVIALWSMTSIRGCDRVVPDGDKIAVDSPHALIVIDEDMPPNKAQAVNSAAVSTWCEENGFELRRHSMADDLSKAEPVWDQMRRRSNNPPELVVATPKRTSVKQFENLKELLAGLEAESQ